VRAARWLDWEGDAGTHLLAGFQAPGYELRLRRARIIAGTSTVMKKPPIRMIHCVLDMMSLLFDR
jgi:hypothetical protein